MDARELSHALHRVSRVLKEGEKTHPPGSDRHWLGLTARDHAARAAVRLENYLLGLKDEPPLDHALTRLLLAVEREARQELQYGLARIGSRVQKVTTVGKYVSP